MVTMPSAKTIGNAGKIDPQLKSLLEKAFGGVIQNNKQLLEWEAALTGLKQKMDGQSQLAEKWLPTFDAIVKNEGKPLTNPQWYGLTSVPDPGKKA